MSDFGRALRVGYWSYRPPINIRGEEGLGLSIPPDPGTVGSISDPVGPAGVSQPLSIIFFANSIAC